MRDVRRNHPAYEATIPPPPRPAEDERPSFMARAAQTPLARILVLAATAATATAGVVTATGAAVVSVINAVAEANARRSNVEIERRLEAVETRMQGRFGLDLEEKARQAKDEELAEELALTRGELRELGARVPAKKRAARAP